MANQVVRRGREFFAKYTFTNQIPEDPNVQIGLRHEASNSLAPNSTKSDIQTEPTASSYARYEPRLRTDASVNRNTTTGVVYTHTFNVYEFDTTSITGQTPVLVDSYFVLIKFQSDEANDTTRQFRLIFSEDLDREYDLTQLDALELIDAGVEYAG